MGYVGQLSTNRGGSYQAGLYPKMEMDRQACADHLLSNRVISIPTTASCWTGTVKVVG